MAKHLLDIIQLISIIKKAPIKEPRARSRSRKIQTQIENTLVVLMEPSNVDIPTIESGKPLNIDV